MAVESPYRMLAVSEAVEIILQQVSPLEAASHPLAELLGRVLADDAYAPEPQPPFPASAKDGYAVVAADTAPVRRLLGEQMAGYVASDLRVEPGAVARITTGAPIPLGADAVVMVEFTHEENGQVHIETQVQPGADIRPVGQDIEQGQRVLEAGTVLGPADIGLLATVGQANARVHRRPRVAVLSTGDELVEPDRPLSPGQIRDSNRYSLLAAVRMTGAEVLDLGRARDEQADLEDKVERGLAEADAVVSSGGVSMGVLDLLKPLLEQHGKVHFGRVNMKPGKPVTFATIDGKPFFGLPGFPVSSLVSFELFVRPALLRMAGHRKTARPEITVRLTHDVRHDPERWEYQRAIVQLENDEFLATTTGFQGSGRLLSMVGANALLRLAPGQDVIPADTRVPALLTGEVHT